ncbi:RNA-binding domain-containing protein [Cadophora sp. DSE1049]|nr:RNA-binding domain-containing protein [Cadophora sp. DSE1049]
MASESPRGRVRTRSPYSDVSKGRGDSRSISRPRRSITPRSISRSPRRNGRYRSESRSVSRGRSPSPVRSTKVVIEKLTKNVNEAHLREIFGQYGQIRDLDMPMNRPFNTNRGTAYILYTSETDAEAAIAHMHESQVDGAVINVSIVLPRRKFSPSPPLARRGINLDPRASFNAAPNVRPPPPVRRRSPLPPYGRSERNTDTYRPRSRSRSRSPRRHRTRSRSLSSRSRSPPRRGRGGGGGGGRRISPPRNGGRRRRSPSYSSYSSYDDRSRSRSRGRGRRGRR